jgi:hypothetical protein
VSEVNGGLMFGSTKMYQSRSVPMHWFLCDELVLTSYFAGAPGRTRTCDARFRKPTLYPLSYGGWVRSCWSN